MSHSTSHSTSRVRLVPATVPLLSALLDNPARFEYLIGSAIPAGWPQFPEAVPYALDFLKQADGADSRWLMHFFVDPSTEALVGSGGYAAPPADRTVEIGYEIAPEFRRRGFARAAVAALVDRAFADGSVDTVLAQTLAGQNPSNLLLQSSGFVFSEARSDPEEGEVWVWSLTRAIAGEEWPGPRRLSARGRPPRSSGGFAG